MRRSNTSGIAISAQLTRPSSAHRRHNKVRRAASAALFVRFSTVVMLLIRNRPKQMVMGAMELVQKARPATIETLDQRHDR